MSCRALPALLLVLGLASSALAAATNFTFVWGDSFGNPTNFSRPLDLSEEYYWLSREYFELPYNSTVDREKPSLYPSFTITLCSDLVEYRPVVLASGRNQIGIMQSSINRWELSDQLAKMNPNGPPDGKVWFYQAHLYDAKNASAPQWSTDSPRFAITNIRFHSAARALRPDFGAVVAAAVAAAGGILVGYW
ncbi:hypothetical protein QBC37DRAFT_422865 [Rhypophila decipiens]|uniref:Uncharacterized protein n=1 Tax=Rhypophila decipiens TaxID=261697 RepID=A0AAN6Y7W7_9PEZI|nr:hypothetical protein QBC37DRAFT_422865 [Rhypophila decipiens]